MADNKMTTVCFTAMDTWFFRETRPHDATGASELNSLFPPPMRTLLGAVRSFIGESIKIDWQAYSQGDGTAHSIDGLDFKAAVGDSENLGELSVRGVFINKNKQRLYPVPFYLMHKEDELIRLQIGNTVECDLGDVRLPELPEGKKGFKNMEQSWIDSQGMQALLKGKQLPDKKQIYSQKQLVTPEARLGIARNNETRSVIEGQLYQTRHIRLADDVKIELNLQGLDEKLAEKLKQNDIVRLGGEGRMASLSVSQMLEKMPFIKTNTAPLTKIILHFISPAYFDGEMFPAEFVKKTVGEQTVWQGTLEGIELAIEAAVIGKVHREGGWDMQKHQPRSVKSYIPAGSAWFCTVLDNSLTSAEVVQALHEKCIGQEQQWGRGQILIGQWIDKQGDTNDSK